MRYRQQNPSDLDRARAAVREWRQQHPQGTAEEMLDEVRHQFHPDYGPVLRAMLFAADALQAKVTTGIPDAGTAR